MLAQFCGNLPQQARREDARVEGLPGLNFELVGRFVPGPVEGCSIVENIVASSGAVRNRASTSIAGCSSA